MYPDEVSFRDGIISEIKRLRREYRFNAALAFQEYFDIDGKDIKVI